MTATWSAYRPGIPGPPVDAAVNPTAQAVFTAICALPTVVCLAMAVKSIVKDRNALWPIFLLSGTIGMFVEPVLDYMGGVWWPVHGDWEAFRLLDVNIPLLVCFVYPWLLGGQAYIAYRAFMRGITVRRLWALAGIFAVNDIVLETIGVRVLRVYAYFGTQPLNPWGLPLWYVPCNAVGPVMAAALFYVMRNQLRGWRMLAAVWFFPMSFVGVYAACGWPVWISLNSDWGIALSTAASLIVFAQAYLIVLVVTRIVGAEDSRGRRHHPCVIDSQRAAQRLDQAAAMAAHGGASLPRPPTTPLVATGNLGSEMGPRRRGSKTPAGLELDMPGDRHAGANAQVRRVFTGRCTNCRKTIVGRPTGLTGQAHVLLRRHSCCLANSDRGRLNTASPASIIND